MAKKTIISTFSGVQSYDTAPLKITGLSTKISGNTGIDKSIFKHHDNDPSLEDIKGVIRAIPPDEYIKEFWDCEDRALYAISKVRCKHPCMPIGLAIGRLADQTIIKGLHALVILWDKDFKSAEFFDPTLNGGDTVDFIPDIIIPMPCRGVRSGEGIPKTEGLLFLKNGGAFVLDSVYDFSAGKIAAAKEFLEKGVLPECSSTCPEYQTSYHSYDRVLYRFINFRREDALKGCPIGIAFGKFKKYGEEALLVFWEKANQNFSFYSWNGAKLSKEEANSFTPTVIIV